MADKKQKPVAVEFKSKRDAWNAFASLGIDSRDVAEAEDSAKMFEVKLTLEEREALLQSESVTYLSDL